VIPACIQQIRHQVFGVERELEEEGGGGSRRGDSGPNRSYTPGACEWSSRRSRPGLYPPAQLLRICIFFWSYVEYKLKLAGWA